MGEYAEDSIQQLSNPFELRRRSGGIIRWDYAEPENCTWTTQAHGVMKLSEMSEHHRGNCLQLLVRRHEDWDFPLGRALIKVGVSDSVRQKLGIPTSLPQYPKLKRTN